MAMIASLPHSTVKYPSYLHRACPCCCAPVAFAYPGRKRTIRDHYGNFQETRYYYRCTNRSCQISEKPFNPAPKSTVLGKRYSISVWKWIGREAKIYNSNPAQIHKRIQEEFDLEISENTIRNILDELDVYLEGRIDEETKKRVADQGKIILSLDGQRPEDGASALWLFVDIISGRVLDVRILDSADHLTLHSCVEEILLEYQVELIGLLSDKQGSIVKMHSEFYPKVPHQYCHFHFLQNIWSFLEAKDSTLQKQLAKMINHLPVVVQSKAATVEIPDQGIVNYREFFAPIEKDLRKLIKNRGKKFESLRGLESFKKIEAYRTTILETIATKPEIHRVTKILASTARKMGEVLQQEHLNYLTCCTLYDDFKQVQQTLGRKYARKSDFDEALAKTFLKIWDSIRSKRRSLQAIKAVLPARNMDKVFIKEQWYRLFRSYRSGLGQFFYFPVQERTNSKMEQKFGQEKMKFIQRSGKANVSRQIRVRGVFELKIQYTRPDEIRQFVENLEGSFDPTVIKQGLMELQERQNIERENWVTTIGGRDALERLFKGGEERKKT